MVSENRNFQPEELLSSEVTMLLSWSKHVALRQKYRFVADPIAEMALPYASLKLNGGGVLSYFGSRFTIVSGPENNLVE